MTVSRDFLAEHFTDYLTFERGLSDRTIEAYGRDLGRVLEFMQERGVEEPSGITSAFLREYMVRLADQGLAASTIRRVQSTIRTYFFFLVGEGAVEADPSERLESPRVWRRLPDVLGHDEVVAILEAPDPAGRLYWRDRAILEFLYATGVRVSELVDLPIVALDLEEGLSLVFGKGSKERLVPVGRPAQRALSRYLAEVRPMLDQGRGEGRVFLNARGRPLSRVSSASFNDAYGPTRSSKTSRPSASLEASVPS